MIESFLYESIGWLAFGITIFLAGLTFRFGSNICDKIMRVKK